MLSPTQAACCSPGHDRARGSCRALAGARALLDAALSKKASVELDFAPDSVVLGERSSLMQVFMNLLTNAERRARGQAEGGFR